VDIWDENSVIICWFYVKNCLFVHMTVKNFFPVTDPLQRPLSHKVKVLEPSLVAENFFKMKFGSR